MNRTTTVSVMTALLLLASGPVMADDQLQTRAQRGQRGGLVGSLPGNQAPPSLPIEAPPSTVPDIATQAPAVAPSTPSNQLPALEDDLGIPQLSVEDDAPLGDVTLPATQQLPATLGDAPAAQQGPTAQAPAKKPGFFKRNWTKVKTFFGNLKDKVAGAFKRNKDKKTDQTAQVSQNSDLQLAGGGDGAGAGAGAAE